ncbi:hypothetical protein ABQF26_04415 [Mycolicibacterium elephantis]
MTAALLDAAHLIAGCLLGYIAARVIDHHQPEGDTMSHPSADGEPFDDDAVEAFARKWEAAHGLPPGGRDPAEVRAEIRRSRDAMAVVLWAVRRDGAMVPDAIDAAADDPDALAALPYTAALAVLGHVSGPTRDMVRQRCTTVLVWWRDRPDANTREAIELAIWRIAGAVWVSLSDSALAAFDVALLGHLAVYAGWR